jgi:peptidoglycan L-alanyl-D-glutamate endopeptidase CwlK
MKYRFGQASSKKLATCCPEMIAVAARALELSPYDFTIIFGFRDEAEQNAIFERGASKKKWPESKHNVMNGDQPASEAIDFAPWVNGGIKWDDTHIFAVVAGCLLAAAKELGVTLRWGGDWDGDGLSKGDQTFFDYGHVEVIL